MLLRPKIWRLHPHYNFSVNSLRYSILNFKQKHFHNLGECLRVVLVCFYISCLCYFPPSVSAEQLVHPLLPFSEATEDCRLHIHLVLTKALTVSEGRCARAAADNIPLFQVPFSVEASLVNADSEEVVSCFGIDGEVVA
jgi:hypothetical protein